MKQSYLQNAVMEFILHAQRRERAVRKQRAIGLENNNALLKEIVNDFVKDQFDIAHI